MLDVLQFIFGSFWRWLGFYLIVASLTPIVVVKRERREK